MHAKIHWERVGVLLVAILGIAGIFFLIGKKSIEQVSYGPAQVTQQAIPAKEVTADDSNTYKNDLYGFGVVFLAKAETATECPLTSRMAYNPIKEYVYADKPLECATDTQDAEGFYSKRGGHLHVMVFDLKKCRDTETDQAEKDFCAKYDTVGITDGKVAQNDWPDGTWTKSGDYIAFYSDLTFGENKNWKSDYKFLVLERR